MLRRPPTVIQLTTEDVLEYDDQRARAHAAAQQAKSAAAAENELGSAAPSQSRRYAQNVGPADTHGGAESSTLGLRADKGQDDGERRRQQERRQRIGLQ